MTVTTTPIETFLAKAISASRMGSKEIRVPISEANELSAAIGKILALNVSLSDQLRETEKLIGANLVVDGGRFK
jgi:hypothetical protein